MAGNGKLSSRQERAILALLTEASVEAAAIAAKVGGRTLHRWLKEDVMFIAAYRAARAAAVSQTIGRLQQASSEAVNTLTDVMRDTDAPAPAKVAAARIVLEMAVRNTEIGELQRRVAELEQSHELPDEPEEETPVVSVD